MEVISYVDIIDWVIGENRKLAYLSPHESIPSWLIIDITYVAYRTYSDDYLEFIMLMISEKIDVNSTEEIVIRQKLLLLNLVMNIYCSCCFPNNLEEYLIMCNIVWYKEYKFQPNKLKEERIKELVCEEDQDNLFYTKVSDYSGSIFYIIDKYDFTVSNEDELLEIIYLLIIIGFICFVDDIKNDILPKFENKNINDNLLEEWFEHFFLFIYGR